MNISASNNTIYVFGFFMYFLGWYFGSSTPEYQYFDQGQYVVRYKAKTNASCIVPDGRSSLVVSAITDLEYCETPWASQILSRIVD